MRDCQVFNDSFEATFTGSASEPSKRLSHVTHFKVLVDRLTSSPVFAEKMTACTTTAGLVHVINAVYSAMAQQLMDAAGPARAAVALEVSCMVRDDVCAGCRSGSPLPCPDSTRGRCVCVCLHLCTRALRWCTSTCVRSAMHPLAPVILAVLPRSPQLAARPLTRCATHRTTCRPAARICFSRASSTTCPCSRPQSRHSAAGRSTAVEPVATRCPSPRICVRV